MSDASNTVEVMPDLFDRLAVTLPPAHGATVRAIARDRGIPISQLIAQLVETSPVTKSALRLTIEATKEAAAAH